MKARLSLSCKVVDLRLEHPLGFDGRVELGVLGKVAVTPGLGDLLGDPGHLLVFHPVELGLQLLIAFLRHRYSVTGHPDLLPIPTPGCCMYPRTGATPARIKT